MEFTTKQLKIAIIGCPSQPDVPWTDETVTRVRDLGFNAIQLNIAWGSRPADEPLNLEDVLEVPPLYRQCISSIPKSYSNGADTSPVAFARRRSDLKKRIDLCKNSGMKSIFHFGAPYNGKLGYSDEPLAQCILDDQTISYYKSLVEKFTVDFPGVDDLLLYTYDQDAWLCNEFGTCERCFGIPVPQRVAPFINTLASTWQKFNPKGLLWWEPWELSAGQVLKTIELLDSQCVGLSLHSNIAEVMVTMPVDRFVRNAVGLACQHGIKVILEGFFGAASEEVEPYCSLAFPLTTWKQTRIMSTLNGVSGVKEYYGLLPLREDPNLRAFAFYFAEPDCPEEQVLKCLALPYGNLKNDMTLFWKLCSEAMEIFPWDVSWFAREIGRSQPAHSLNAAFLRGQQCHSPSWDSTRRAIFMKTDDLEPEPWLLEDVQMRCELSASRWKAGLELGCSITNKTDFAFLPEHLRDYLIRNLDELAGLLRRVTAYALHLRETNVAYMLRKINETGQPFTKTLCKEMDDLLDQDLENWKTEGENNFSLKKARRLWQNNPTLFLAKYFNIPEKNGWPCGSFSLTSR